MSPERFTSLLESARQGREAAWQELYNGLAPVVLGYLRANGAPDPEAVLSEVFLQVARDITTFDGEERGFRSWVFTIAHHRLIDARRHSARRPVDLSPEPPEPGDRAAIWSLRGLGCRDLILPPRDRSLPPRSLGVSPRDPELPPLGLKVPP